MFRMKGIPLAAYMRRNGYLISLIDQIVFNTNEAALLLGGRFSLNAHWIRFIRINAKLLNRFGDYIWFNLAFVSQRLKRSNHNEVAVNFEEVTQLSASVTATETFSTQHSILAGNVGAQLLRVCFQIVSCYHEWTSAAFQL